MHTILIKWSPCLLSLCSRHLFVADNCLNSRIDIVFARTMCDCLFLFSQVLGHDTDLPNDAVLVQHLESKEYRYYCLAALILNYRPCARLCPTVPNRLTRSNTWDEAVSLDKCVTEGTEWRSQPTKDRAHRSWQGHNYTQSEHWQAAEWGDILCQQRRLRLASAVWHARMTALTLLDTCPVCLDVRCDTQPVGVMWSRTVSAKMCSQTDSLAGSSLAIHLLICVFFACLFGTTDSAQGECIHSTIDGSPARFLTGGIRVAFHAICTHTPPWYIWVPLIGIELVTNCRHCFIATVTLRH